MTSPAHSSKTDASSTETVEPIWGARMGWLYVETHSTGVNRIKGGSVQVN